MAIDRLSLTVVWKAWLSEGHWVLRGRERERDQAWQISSVFSAEPGNPQTAWKDSSASVPGCGCTFTVRSACICCLSLASKPPVCPGSVPETDLYIRQSSLLPRAERAVSLRFCFWKTRFAEGTTSLACFLTSAHSWHISPTPRSATAACACRGL